MMESLSHAKKRIAVSDKNGHTISILKDILDYCDRQIGVTDAVGEQFSQNEKPMLLLLCGEEQADKAKNFEICVTDYELAALPALNGLNPLTFSTASDSADFTARNIRQTADGLTAFEIIGVGVIGRVKLADRQAVTPALAAAAAAIACGVPFAEVMDALNHINEHD
jgi:hypothetical protein